ncbi:MAG TPA: hypothetical protein VGS96_23055 [Thermoanaerobaculia bacterium]|jgi:hypothetical protein|nr:hypothetical protein [Thermoanaerobaculia bacterium]
MVTGLCFARFFYDLKKKGRKTDLTPFMGHSGSVLRQLEVPKVGEVFERLETGPQSLLDKSTSPSRGDEGGLAIAEF